MITEAVRELKRKSSKRIRAKRKAEKKCYECGEPVHGNHTRCLNCIIIGNERGRNRRTSRKELGLCEKCNNPRKEGRNRCEACLVEQRAFAKARNKRLKTDAFEAYGGFECACCHTTYTPCLELDHVYGGGNKHRRECGGDSNTVIYLWLKNHNYPKGMMQVLCSNCNRAKHLLGKCGCQEHLKSNQPTEEEATIYFI